MSSMSSMDCYWECQLVCSAIKSLGKVLNEAIYMVVERRVGDERGRLVFVRLSGAINTSTSPERNIVTLVNRPRYDSELFYN